MNVEKAACRDRKEGVAQVCKTSCVDPGAGTAVLPESQRGI